MNPATTKTSPLQQSIQTEESKVRDYSGRQYGRLWEAYETACSLLSQLAQQGGSDSDGKPLNGPERLSLTASLLQSCFILEHLISSGYYVSSVAILRQHMEILARVIELRQGLVKDSKTTPNVKLLPFRLSRNYGRLSEIFHTSSGEYLSCFVEDLENEAVATFLPSYRDDWSRILFAVHIAHLVTLAQEIDSLHKDLYPNKTLISITEELNSIASILAETGFWEELPNKPLERIGE